MSLKRMFTIVLAVVVLSVVLSTLEAAAGSNNATSKYYTCQKARCYSYNSDGTARYNTVYGVRYRASVWYGSKVFGSKLSSGWLKQDLFRSQSVYFISSDFK